MVTSAMPLICGPKTWCGIASWKDVKQSLHLLMGMLVTGLTGNEQLSFSTASFLPNGARHCK